MAAISSDQIVSILREEITNYDFNQNDEEVGKVVRVGDGIATIYGMNHAMYGEIVVFDSGSRAWSRILRRTKSVASCLVRIARSTRVLPLCVPISVPACR